MAKLSIKVDVAGRTYPLSVDEGEKEGVLDAAEKINKAIQSLKKNYAVTDMHDLLAMASLQLIAKKDALNNNENSQVVDQIEIDLKKLTDEIDEAIK